MLAPSIRLIRPQALSSTPALASALEALQGKRLRRFSRCPQDVAVVQVTVSSSQCPPDDQSSRMGRSLDDESCSGRSRHEGNHELRNPRPRCRSGRASISGHDHPQV